MKKILVFAVVIFVGYASLSDYISNFSLDNLLEPASPNGSAPTTIEPTTIEPTTIEPTTLPTTETGNKQFSAGTWCAGKLSEEDDKVLTEPFRKDGIAAGLVPSWKSIDRCLSAEIISRLSQNRKINDGWPGNRAPQCSARTGDQQFFPSADPNETSSWFFGPLKECQGISEREFRNCTKKPDTDQAKAIRAGDQNQLIDSGCIFSPDGRLVIENIAPIWDLKNDVQTLVYSPQIEFKSGKKNLEKMKWALPANGCLTLRTDSECKKDATGLTLYKAELNEWQSCLIKSATRRIGALYGRGNANDEEGLTGINNAEKIGEQKVTFDCVALVHDLGVDLVKGRDTNAIFNSKDSQKEEEFWVKFREAESWEDVAKTLPIGTLLSTDNHLSIVVGYLEREQNLGFHPIVVEAENFLVGIVRAKIKDVAGLDKKTRTVLVGRIKCNIP